MALRCLTSNSEPSMHLRFVISLIVATLSVPAIFAQGTNQPTVDGLVAKNIEASARIITMGFGFIGPSTRGRDDPAAAPRRIPPDESRDSGS